MSEALLAIAQAYALAAAAMVLVMLLAWAWQQRGGAAGIVDVVWTLGVGVIGVVFALMVADGNINRRLILAGCIAGWSLRLGIHLLPRVFPGAPEDERYRKLHEGWGTAARWRMLLFYQSQALASPLFTLPMLIGGRSVEPFGVWDGLGVLIWAAALAGEWQADRQLAWFRPRQENRGQVCRMGWWRYSRHPNYFFEWLHWCSYVPLAVFAPLGWLALLPPAAMYYFLNFVTGIPPAEAQALARRGDAYREYQRTTSAFFPWPPG